MAEATALKDALEQRDKLTAELRTLTHDAESGEELETLTPENEARTSEILEEVRKLDEGIARETAQVKQVRLIEEARAAVAGGSTQDGTTNVQVVSEEMVYGCNEHYRSDNSWWGDQITLSRGEMDPFYHEARERLLKWGHQVEVEVANRSDFGRKAVEQFREQFRDRDGMRARRVLEEISRRGRASLDAKDSAELRTGIGTGGGPTVSATSGASSFITPAFVGPYVPYRQYGRAFADQCEKPQMPDFGMAIYKPVVTGPAGFGSFTEVSGTVTEVDPTAGYLAGTLGIYAGQVELSQAVLDRTAPNYRFDLMVQDQIERKEAPVLDTYVITQALTGATAIPYTASFAVSSTSGVTSSLYGHVSQAKATMRKAAGAVLNPTHVWLDPARWEVVAGWGDANGRPVTVPDYAGPYNALAAGSADGDAGIEGATGYRFNGLRSFTDANLPTTGGTAAYDQVIVTCQNEIEYYEGNAYNRILPQTLASNLLTIVQRYRYVATIVNYAAAVQPIQGAAFVAPTWGS